MAKVLNGMNSDYVEYFPLDEYINKIKLFDNVLEHLQDTNNNFVEYMNKLSLFNDDYITNYWIYLLYKELNYSKKIENMKFDKIDLQEKSVFFDTLSISHKRIHELHNFATEGEYDPTFQYRNKDVNVSRLMRMEKKKSFGVELIRMIFISL